MDHANPRSVDAPLEIERLETTDGLVLLLSGELDNSNGHRVLAELDHAGDDRIIFDTTGLTFLDSRGLMTLISSRDRVGPDRFEIRLIPDGPVDRLFSLTGLSDQFEIVAAPYRAD